MELNKPSIENQLKATVVNHTSFLPHAPPYYFSQDPLQISSNTIRTFLNTLSNIRVIFKNMIKKRYQTNLQKRKEKYFSHEDPHMMIKELPTIMELQGLSPQEIPPSGT